MLYFIGLGLGDAKDITVKGLEVVKCAKKVFLEHYTSILSCGKTDLEEFYGRNDLILADRDLVESGADKILEDAKVCFSWFMYSKVPTYLPDSSEFLTKLGIPELGEC